MTRSTKNSCNAGPPDKSSCVVAVPEQLNAETGCSLSKEGNQIVSLLSAKIDALIDKLNARDVVIERLTNENAAFQERVSKLEDRIEHLEATNCSSNVVLSGRELSRLPTGDTLEQSAIIMLRDKLQYELSPSKVTSVYRLGARPQNQSPDSRSIMIKLLDIDTKKDIVSACRTVKPPDLYANDDLTPIRAKILYTLRKARRGYPTKISSCGSHDGRVFLYLKPPNPTGRAQKIFIGNQHELEDLCVRQLGASPNEIVAGN